MTSDSISFTFSNGIYIPMVMDEFQIPIFGYVFEFQLWNQWFSWKNFQLVKNWWFFAQFFEFSIFLRTTVINQRWFKKYILRLGEEVGIICRLISGRYLSLILRTTKHWFKLDIFTSMLQSYWNLEKEISY